jgi:hypothetical protein
VAYYADFSPCDYFGRWQEALIAVGWLEPGHSFATGNVSKEFFAQLVGLLKDDPWQPVATAGYQRCAFCRFTGGPSTIHFESNSIVVGTNNLFILAGCVYVAPSLIAHYIGKLVRPVC